MIILCFTSCSRCFNLLSFRQYRTLDFWSLRQFVKHWRKDIMSWRFWYHFACMHRAMFVLCIRLYIELYIDWSAKHKSERKRGCYKFKSSDISASSELHELSFAHFGIKWPKIDFDAHKSDVCVTLISHTMCNDTTMCILCHTEQSPFCKTLREWLKNALATSKWDTVCLAYGCNNVHTHEKESSLQYVSNQRVTCVGAKNIHIFNHIGQTTTVSDILNWLEPVRLLTMSNTVFYRNMSHTHTYFFSWIFFLVFTCRLFFVFLTLLFVWARTLKCFAL